MTHQQVLRFFCGLNIAFGIGLAILETAICVAKLNAVGFSTDPEEVLGMTASLLTICCAIIVILLNNLVKGYSLRDRIYEVINCILTFGCFSLLLAVLIVFFSQTIVHPGGDITRNLYGLKLTAIIAAFILLSTMTITYFLCVYSCGRVVSCRQFDQTFTSKVTYNPAEMHMGSPPAETGPSAKSEKMLQSDVFLEPSDIDIAVQRKYLGDGTGKTFSCSTDTTLSDF